MTTLFDAPRAVPAPPACAASIRPLVIGLDLSLTSTGIASHGWVAHIRTGSQRGDGRLAFLENEVTSYIRNADMVVMEGPSYGHGAMAGHEDLAGLRVIVRRYCFRHHIPYAVIPPSTLKLYVAGKGNAAKGEVRTAVAELYGIHTEGAARYDEADAYAAAAAAYDWLGYPLATVPDRQRAALAGCAWPTPVPVCAR